MTQDQTTTDTAGRRVHCGTCDMPLCAVGAEDPCAGCCACLDRCIGESSLATDDTTDQPDGITGGSDDLPDPARAVQRVGEFLSAYGDGLIEVEWSEDYLAQYGGEAKPLYARDLEALRKAAAPDQTTGTAGEIRRLGDLLRAEESSRDHWKERCEEARAELASVRERLAARDVEIERLNGISNGLIADWEREQTARVDAQGDMRAVAEQFPVPVADPDQVRFAVRALLWLHAEAAHERERLRALVVDSGRDFTRLFRALGLPQETDMDEAVEEAGRIYDERDRHRRRVKAAMLASLASSETPEVSQP